MVVHMASMVQVWANMALVSVNMVLVSVNMVPVSANMVVHMVPVLASMDNIRIISIIAVNDLMILYLFALKYNNVYFS